MERRVGGTIAKMANAPATYPTVIPRESGESSTPRRLDSITSVAEYWIARPSARKAADDSVRVEAARATAVRSVAAVAAVRALRPGVRHPDQARRSRPAALHP